MNQKEKESLIIGTVRSVQNNSDIGGLSAVAALWRLAEAVGRESVLEAARNLLGTRQSHDLKTLQYANRAGQATNTIQALSDWCDLDQTTNRFDCGKTSLDDPLKQYKVVLWNTPNHGGEAHTYIFGSTMADAMAKAAQWCLLEIDHAKRSGK